MSRCWNEAAPPDRVRPGNRQSDIAGTRTILRLVDTWQGYTRRHPVVAMLAVAVPFMPGMMGIHALNGIVYYNNNETIPDALIGTISALYLGATFVIGLVTPLRVGAVGPVLAFPALTLLWPLTPWDSYGNLTYDSGWAGPVLYPLVPIAIIGLAAWGGRGLGGPLEERP